MSTTLPTAGARLRLSGLPDDVLLVRIDVAAPADAADLAVLSDTERQRAARFHHDRDRDRFITTRAALRRLLADRTGGRPEEVVFGEEGRGKPVLSSDAGIRFSVAHADGHAVVAIAARPVGVDVEVVRPDTWDPAMAGLVLSPAELRWVREHGDTHPAFFRCWTRKEAFVKLGSAGLIDELRTLTLTPIPDAGVTASGVLLVDGAIDARVLVACAVAPGRTSR